MSTTFVIDGYNLLHAMGVLGGKVGPHGLEKARAGLLGLIRGAMADQTSAVTVVFDGAAGPQWMGAQKQDHGIKVIFAQGKQEADDVIETLIRQASAPKSMEVVSNDHRIQQAAKRRGCKPLGCDEFLDWLEQHRRKTRESARELPEKREKLGDEEIKRWLAEFADLERDPSLKQAFERFDFEEGQ